MAAASATTTPLGTEIIPVEPRGGAAPWERQGAEHRSPDDPESRAKADKWKKRAAAAELEGDDDTHVDSRRRRAAERRAKKEEVEAARVKQLEKNARRMYFLGFFALPLLWLVSLLYFHADYKSAEPNPVIKKYYKGSRLMLVLYSIIFIAWFVVFQVYRDTRLKDFNILHFKGQSPTGF